MEDAAASTGRTLGGRHAGSAYLAVPATLAAVCAAGSRSGSGQSRGGHGCRLESVWHTRAHATRTRTSAENAAAGRAEQSPDLVWRRGLAPSPLRPVPGRAAGRRRGAAAGQWECAGARRNQRRRPPRRSTPPRRRPLPALCAPNSASSSTPARRRRRTVGVGRCVTINPALVWQVIIIQGAGPAAAPPAEGPRRERATN